MGATALPTRGGTNTLALNPLPTIPANFWLGEDGLPCTTGQTAMAGYDYLDEGRGSPPGPGGTRKGKRILDDADRGRAKEIQNLATAMLTVDNGFEDQWWYRGTRLVNVAGDLISPAALADMYQSSTLPVWTMSNSNNDTAEPAAQMPPNSSDIVSPVSDFSVAEREYPKLRRSITMQSDELHL